MRSLLVIAFTTAALASPAHAATMPPSDAGIAAMRGFGGPGHVIVSVGNTQLVHEQADKVDLIPSSTNLTGSLAVDLVLPRDWTAGLGAMVSWHEVTTDTTVFHQTTCAISGRLGHVIPFSPFATFWPVLSLGAERGPGAFANTPETSVVATLDLPIVITPVPHFFVGAGPTFAAGTGGHVDLVTLYGHIVFEGIFGS